MNTNIKNSDDTEMKSSFDILMEEMHRHDT